MEIWNWTDDPVDSWVGFSFSDALKTLIEYALEGGAQHPTLAGHFTDSGTVGAANWQTVYANVVARTLPDEPMRALVSTERENSLDAGRFLLDEALRRYPETDLLLCSSDVLAVGALLECQARGIEVPRRLGITGFGNQEIARHVRPAITTVSIPSRRIGAHAGEVLLARITNKSTMSSSVDLGFEEITGDSIRRQSDKHPDSF